MGEKFHKTGGISKLVNLALTDSEVDVRSKAVYAISSYVRNYAEGLEQCISTLPAGLKEEYSQKKLDAEDMESIDEFRSRLKAEGNKSG